MYVNPSARTYTYPGPPPPPTISSFHSSLSDYNTTPLISLPSIAKSLSLSHVLLKDESSRFGLPAFKILGASWAIQRAVAKELSLPATSSLDDLGHAAREKGIRLVTSTEGNWGRATARMAKYLGIQALVFVPDDMDEGTRGRIASEGAKVVVVDGNYDYSCEVMKKEAEKDRSLLVTDVSWEGFEEIPNWVVQGYSTMLVETDAQLADHTNKPITHVIASVGVGSWAQAVTMHYKSESRRATVVTVEPTNAACLLASLEAGVNTPITTHHTIMNGMNCGTVSYTAWPVLRDGVDASVTVSDLEAHKDLQELHDLGVKNGPCGAATLSALRKLCEQKKVELGLDENSVVVLFSTEGARDYVLSHSGAS